MIKPKHLQKGDKVAIVSLSLGMLGEPEFIHKYDIAKKRLEEDFGLQVVCMENALKGIQFLGEHPELRAKDLHDAFVDESIKAVFCAIGGNDAIKMLPYVDFDLLHNNPKIFTGFSDTTSNHFMMFKAGLMSYYGANIMNNFSEYVKINPYTRQAIVDTLFEPKEELEITSAPYYYDDEDEKIWWGEHNMHIYKPYHPEERGYEIIQGGGIVEGELLGGCLDVFSDIMKTELWPEKEAWKGKILFAETSEEDMSAEFLESLLMRFYEQGIFEVLHGIIVGKPAKRSKYEPYKEVFKKVVGEIAGRKDMPIMFNVNFGHAEPIGVLPYGAKLRLNAEEKRLTLLEKATL